VARRQGRTVRYNLGMTPEQTLHAAIVRDPGDDLAWLALADWLEEDGQAARAELLRLTRSLREIEWEAEERGPMEQRVIELLSWGVRPANPEVINSVGMRFRLIPPGTFLMGATNAEGGVPAEWPRHEVTLTKPFAAAVFPVTQLHYSEVMGVNPSAFCQGGTEASRVGGRDTAHFPVESVSYPGATEFCRELSARPEEVAARRSYRLPTEAEWEYCCRGGALCATPYHTGWELRPKQANYRVNGQRPCPVGSYPANAFGLCDMHGQVAEWVSDWFDGKYYRYTPPADPTGPGSGASRVIRGGSWNSWPEDCRSAYRGPIPPGASASEIGFRVVMVPQ
jgi:uncharacterized protein (TIGR02996 family)